LETKNHSEILDIKIDLPNMNTYFSMKNGVPVEQRASKTTFKLSKMYALHVKPFIFKNSIESLNREEHDRGLL